MIGEVRVQALSPTLVRIEQKGPQGFEDRKTLTVVNRNWAGIPVVTEQQNGRTLLKTASYQIGIPTDAADLTGITLHAPSGELLHTISPDDLKFDYLPAPGKMPRVVPPACPRSSARINTMLGLSGAVGLSAAKHERPQMDKVRGSGCVSWFRLNYRFLSVLLTLSTALSAFLLFP